MDNCLHSPGPGCGIEVCVGDKGSAVRTREKAGNVGEGDNQTPDRPGGGLAPYIDGEITQGNEEGTEYASPMETVETEQTVVASNQQSGVSYVEAPRVGMVFKSWQEVESYYKEYGEQMGFGVSRVQGEYSKGIVRDRISTTWRCECYGRPDMRAQREARKRAKVMGVSGAGEQVGGIVGVVEFSNSKRRSKKCECEAKVYARVNGSGQWVIKGVELEHTNHEPIPSNSKLVKEYRMKQFTSRVRKKLLKYYDRGVPVSQIHGCLSSEFEGLDPLPYTVKDLQHEIYKSRKLKMEGGDSTAMMNFFTKMQGYNQNFFHSQRLDDEGRLKDVLWVDARSRAAYDEFGDVVCFDATYMTNQYDLPFLNFVGVNHHGQSILLGCALVSHEDCDTYLWVFNQWLECMKDKAPLAILTDQAAAMRKPLEEVMPTSRHRWCIWHIMRKIPDKLGKLERYAHIKVEMKAVVYNSFSIMQFENGWKEMVVKYKLEGNDWLDGLYNERHMWVPAFMREYFWAGMKTTQRVESINSFFDGFVNRQTKLCEFPEKYAQAMAKRVEAEVDADAKCSKYIRRIVTGFLVERVFQKIYTDTKFQEVQTECMRVMYCYPREENKITDTLLQYLIEDRVWVVPEGRSEEIVTDKRRFYSASFDTETKVVCCDCRMFETCGIMCRHIIRILDLNLVTEIPESYILKRWRKDIPRRHTMVKVSYHDPEKTEEGKRYNTLMQAFETICEEAALVNEETVSMVMNSLQKIKADVCERRKRKFEETVPISYANEGPDTFQENSVNDNETQSTVQQQCENGNGGGELFSELQTEEQVVLKDPPTKKRGRGRPKGSRNKSLAEIGYKKPTKEKGQVKKAVEVCADVDPLGNQNGPPPKKMNVRRKSGRTPTQANGDGDPRHVPEDDILVIGSSNALMG